MFDMKVENKRIFIGDLPETVTKNDIQTAFSEYGKVTSVDIKERKKLNNLYKSLFFAYVNLDIDDRGLQKCFMDFTNGKWLEEPIRLQIAKESFLDRLKSEREVQNIVNTNASENTHLEKTFNDFIKVPNKRKTFSDTDDHIDGINIRENKKISKTVTTTNETDNLSDTGDMKNLPDLNYKQSNTSKMVLKIPSVGHKPIITVDLHKKEDVIKSEDNLKRLESLKNLKKGYQNKKSLIQAALSNVDVTKNKIIFDDELVSSKKMSKDNQILDGTKQKILLFNEESDEDDNINFEVKKQFEGEKGQKLLELQSKYKSDKRFTLDSRFLDDEQDDVDMTETSDNNGISIQEEKKKELEILSEVLGKKITAKTAQKPESSKKSMLRFDPTQPEHSKFEISNERLKSDKKKKTSETTINEKKQEEKEVPSVSKEVFYQLNENIKESLHENEGFSLLNMFGTVSEADEQEKEEVPLKIDTNKKMKEINPFRYESSDDDDETGHIPDQATIRNDKTSINNGQTNRTKSTFWTEPFFFKPDDYRLQEGFDFIEKMKFDEKTDFSKLRRDLKEIVKAKVRNNQSKKKPFKRKLGGNKKRKMIRMKKALKK